MSRKNKTQFTYIIINFSVRNKEAISIGKKILACSLLLVLMALLPFTAVKCSGNSDKNRLTSSTGKTINDKKISDNNEILVGLTAALCNENSSDEAIKAIAILLNTDYEVNPDYFDLENKDVYLSKDEIDNSVKEYYSRVESIVKSMGKKSLTTNNEKFFIPYSQSSCGYTLDSKDCEYITSVASPWDCFSKSYGESSQCVGVSIDGINYLCNNGTSAEQALKWYLPEFQINS